MTAEMTRFAVEWLARREARPPKAIELELSNASRLAFAWQVSYMTLARLAFCARARQKTASLARCVGSWIHSTAPQHR